jgi:hypothetical protein
MRSCLGCFNGCGLEGCELVGYGLVDYELRVKHSTLQQYFYLSLKTGYLQFIINFHLHYFVQTTNNKQQTTNNKQQTTNNKQQTTNNKQQTTNNSLLQQPILHCIKN